MLDMRDVELSWGVLEYSTCPETIISDEDVPADFVDVVTVPKFLS